MAQSLTLRNIPADIYKILLREQAREKESRSIGMFGLEQAIYKLIRECERCRKESKK